MTDRDSQRLPDLDAHDVPWAWMLKMPTVDEWLDSLSPLDDDGEEEAEPARVAP